jgi:hypothetical protein
LARCAVPTNNAMDLPARSDVAVLPKIANARVGSCDHLRGGVHAGLKPDNGVAKRATVRVAERGESQRFRCRHLGNGSHRSATRHAALTHYCVGAAGVSLSVA